MIVTSVEQLEELQVAAKGRLKSQFKKRTDENKHHYGGRKRKERKVSCTDVDTNNIHPLCEN